MASTKVSAGWTLLVMAMRKPRHPPLGPRIGRAHARVKLCPYGIAKPRAPLWRSGPALLAVLLSGLPAVAAPTVMIERCHDGDSCRTTNGEAIRLACIDAPELTGPPNAQRLAQASRDYLRELVVGKEVLIRRIGKDRYGRAVAEIYLWPLNIGEEMVASGHARILDRYASQCPWALL